MKYARLIVAMLAFGVGPALAQGLPGLEKRVEQLEAQDKVLQSLISILQGQIDNQQVQISNLSSVIVPDDGTAAALAGTWTGNVNSLEFDTVPRSQPFFAVNGALSPVLIFFSQVGSFLPPPPVQVSVNPQFWLAKRSSTSITFNITRDGMKLSGSGFTTPPPPLPGQQPEPSQSFFLTGIVLSNNFFLLKVRIPVPVGTIGNCIPSSGFVTYQGVGSLNPDNRRGGVFTASGVDANCQHSVFRVGLTKPPPP